MSGEKLLDDHAAQGWRLKSITGAGVEGCTGPGGVEGLLVTFEKEIRREGRSAAITHPVS